MDRFTINRSMLHTCSRRAISDHNIELTVQLALALIVRNILDYFDAFSRVIVELLVHDHDDGLCSMETVDIFQMKLTMKLTMKLKLKIITEQ